MIGTFQAELTLLPAQAVLSLHEELSWEPETADIDAAYWEQQLGVTVGLC